MKSLKNLTGDSLEQLIDYNVVDQHGDEIGTLHSLWSDPDTGAVEFLGVKTGWLFGQNHVVPAEKAELDDATNVVRLPYTEAFIKEAPAISADAEISEEEETSIYQYYGMTRTGGASAAAGDHGEAHRAGSTGNSTLPEAAGASSLAGSSTLDEGAGGFAAAASGGAAAAAGANRWQRVSRPGDADAATTGAMGSAGGASSTFGNPATAPTAGASVRAALDDLAPSDTSGRREPLTPAAPGAYATANLYGSTGLSTPVSADSLGASYDPGTQADRGANTRPSGPRGAGGANRDPITGEPGAHPVGTGVGALAAGATGAAVGGAVGGPVGAPVGAVIGAIVGGVGGGLVGKGVAESINPTGEDAYWQSNYKGTPYFQKGYEYADYAPAYQTGVEGYGRYAGEGRDFDAAEPHLQRDYEQAKGNSRLEWDKARAATRDAWERLKGKASAEPK